MHRYATRNPYPFHNSKSTSANDGYCTYARGVLARKRTLKRKRLLARVLALVGVR